MGEQPHGILVEFASLLFQADDQVPAHWRGELQHRRLRIKRVQQEDVNKRAAIKLRQSGQQTQCGRILAFARLQPLHRQHGFDGTADHLTTHRPMVW